jgi:hypothetical protein
MQAQTGPGGVGNTTSNILWLDAGSGITVAAGAVASWADRSGNGNNATQGTANLKPQWHSNIFNGKPAVTFDNDPVAADHLRIPDNSTLEGMSGLSAFVVYQLATGTADAAPRGFFSKRNGVDDQEAYDWFVWNPSGSVVQNLDIDGTANRASGTVAISMDVPCINSFVFKGSSPTNSQNQVLYNGNTAVGNAAESSASVPNYTSDLYLGILRGHTGSGSNVTRFNGKMAELIMYNTALGVAQRTIVNNYLAAKYGIALASGDLYLQDNADNGEYDQDVAGIGQASALDRQTDSRGTGIVEIAGATDLGNDEFLLWGSDAGALGTFGVADRPAGVQGRWQRTWRVNEVKSSGAACDVGAIDISFDLTGQGAVSPSDLRLLVDVDKDGLFADETPISGAVWVTGNTYRFSGVTAIADGVRFTLGTVNASATPLPIQLLSFTATVDASRAVRLDWSTASEQHNDHFTVQRSTDASQWGNVGELPGAGNSSSVLRYTWTDPAPLVGTSYYRLQQTDDNGASTLSQSVVVQWAGDGRITVRPDPAHTHFSVGVEDAASWNVRLIDPRGSTVRVPLHAEGREIVVEVGSIAPGPYLLLLEREGERRSAHVQVN